MILGVASSQRDRLRFAGFLAALPSSRCVRSTVSAPHADDALHRFMRARRNWRRDILAHVVVDDAMLCELAASLVVNFALTGKQPRFLRWHDGWNLDPLTSSPRPQRVKAEQRPLQRHDRRGGEEGAADGAREAASHPLPLSNAAEAMAAARLAGGLPNRSCPSPAPRPRSRLSPAMMPCSSSVYCTRWKASQTAISA